MMYSKGGMMWSGDTVYPDPSRGWLRYSCTVALGRGRWELFISSLGEGNIINTFFHLPDIKRNKQSRTSKAYP